MIPLVTCLILTRNRRQWLPRAIDYALGQAYPRVEVLVVADGEDVEDLVPTNARLIRSTERLSIGEKRNLGCEAARGEIIAHFDDDDYSASGRLADQVGRLARAVTGYHTMRCTDGTDWWLYVGSPNYALGTSLCYRREWWSGHPFPDLNVGEDNAFVAAANAEGQLTTADAGNFMHFSIHAGNASPKPTEQWVKI